MNNNKHRRKGRIEQKGANSMIKHIEEFTTKELAEELKERGGVEMLKVAPHEQYEIHREKGSTIESGPAVILIVED